MNSKQKTKDTYLPLWKKWAYGMGNIPILAALLLILIYNKMDVEAQIGKLSVNESTV